MRALQATSSVQLDSRARPTELLARGSPVCQPRFFSELRETRPGKVAVFALGSRALLRSFPRQRPQEPRAGVLSAHEPRDVLPLFLARGVVLVRVDPIH